MKSYSQFIDEALLPSLIKAAARQFVKSKALQKAIPKVGKEVTKTIKLLSRVTGFQTGRGSKYTYTQKPQSWPQTQRTAAKDPYHPTAPGVKQKSDYTMFTTPDASMTMRDRFVSGSKEPFYKELPQSTTPKRGRAPVEVWNKYAEKGGNQAIHPGSPITDIQTTTRGSNVGLYGAQRKELKDRVKAELQTPANIEALKKELGIKPMDSSNSSTTYRNLGAGRKESVKEQKSFSDLISEANRKAQRASKSGKTPKEGPRSKGDDKPKAVVTVGLPGSGKSTIAKHMVSKGKTDQHELDKSRQALGKGPAYFGQDIVKHTYDGAKKSAKQGKSTVLSNTSIPRQHRKDAIDKLKDSGYTDVKAVLTPGSTKAAMRRNRKRTGSKPGEGAVPQFVMNRMAQGMKGMSRAERRELRGNYKELHKSERFTKPAMKRSGAIKEDLIQEGMKKELRRAFDQGLRDGRPEIVTKAPPESSAPTAPGSPERMAQIKREILGQSGGGKVEKAQNDKNKAFKKRRKEAIERIANKSKPKMNVTKVDAKKTFREFLEESAKRRIAFNRYHHGTSTSNAEKIKKSGFQTSEVHASTSSDVAKSFGSRKGEGVSTIQMRIPAKDVKSDAPTKALKTQGQRATDNWGREHHSVIMSPDYATKHIIKKKPVIDAPRTPKKYRDGLPKAFQRRTKTQPKKDT